MSMLERVILTIILISTLLMPGFAVHAKEDVSIDLRSDPTGMKSHQKDLTDLDFKMVGQRLIPQEVTGLDFKMIGQRFVPQEVTGLDFKMIGQGFVLQEVTGLDFKMVGQRFVPQEVTGLDFKMIGQRTDLSKKSKVKLEREFNELAAVLDRGGNLTYDELIRLMELAGKLGVRLKDKLSNTAKQALMNEYKRMKEIDMDKGDIPVRVSQLHSLLDGIVDAKAPSYKSKDISKMSKTAMKKELDRIIAALERGEYLTNNELSWLNTLARKLGVKLWNRLSDQVKRNLQNEYKRAKEINDSQHGAPIAHTRRVRTLDDILGSNKAPSYKSKDPDKMSKAEMQKEFDKLLAAVNRGEYLTNDELGWFETLATKLRVKLWDKLTAKGKANLRDDYKRAKDISGGWGTIPINITKRARILDSMVPAKKTTQEATANKAPPKKTTRAKTITLPKPKDFSVTVSREGKKTTTAKALTLPKPKNFTVTVLREGEETTTAKSLTLPKPKNFTVTVSREGEGITTAKSLTLPKPKNFTVTVSREGEKTTTAKTLTLPKPKDFTVTVSREGEKTTTAKALTLPKPKDFTVTVLKEEKKTILPSTKTLSTPGKKKIELVRVTTIFGVNPFSRDSIIETFSTESSDAVPLTVTTAVPFAVTADGLPTDGIEIQIDAAGTDTISMVADSGNLVPGATSTMIHILQSPPTDFGHDSNGAGIPGFTGITPGTTGFSFVANNTSVRFVSQRNSDGTFYTITVTAKSEIVGFNTIVTVTSISGYRCGTTAANCP